MEKVTYICKIKLSRLWTFESDLHFSMVYKKKQYSDMATSSPGRFSLALEVVADMA